MGANLDKRYEFSEFEGKIYERWMKSECFKGKAKSLKERYVIVMPPPNVTGKLHMGHALDIVLQDSLIRFKKMNGYETLWVPGVDHAAIATEVKLVQKLKEEGLTKEQIGREEFLKRAFKWKDECEGQIVNQLKKIGVACDWSRKRFTMDSLCANAVLEFFLRLYKDGFIYRGERVINWCYSCNTSLADVEVKYEEEDGNLYYLKYKFLDSDDFLVIATTRPETIFADVAVAVNPNDERYKKYIGKTVLVPITNEKIPVIGDSYVDLKFGTGVLKITPGHDFNDFEIGQRHNLKIINLFTKDGRLNCNALEFKDLSIKKARKEVILKLENCDALVKVEELKHNVGHCYRCNHIVEPVVSLQWFVKMAKLKEPAIKAVKDEEIRFIPKRFEKIYFNWLENLKDWCISRHLWWGHKIPAYYCKDCGHINISKTRPSSCEKCEGKFLEEEKDTLDTWFSSALWPFSTLGWPNEESEDYKAFYPTTTLVTGYDIIFFWVFRMIFAGIYSTKKAPFKNVLIHGLVRDEQGRKMSKSLDNGVDPIEIIEKYGADALRFTLESGVNAGSDLRYSEKKLIASRNFANKLWNASRFIFMNMQELGVDFKSIHTEKLDSSEFQMQDRWILYKLNELIIEITKNIDSFEFAVATAKIYHFTWEVFCDWYIELFKIKTKDLAKKTLNIIIFILENILKLLHPFMPFITQRIYLELNKKEELIVNHSWPKANLNFNFEKEAKDFEKVIVLIKELRNFRAQMNIAKKIKFHILIKTEFEEILNESKDVILKLALCEDISFIKEFPENNKDDFKKIVTDFAIIFVMLKGVIDEKQEEEKFQKEKAFLEKEIMIFEKKLSNENFLNKAPKDIVEKEKEKLKLKKEKLKKLILSLK